MERRYEVYCASLWCYWACGTELGYGRGEGYGTGGARGQVERPLLHLRSGRTAIAYAAMLCRTTIACGTGVGLASGIPLRYPPTRYSYAICHPNLLPYPTTLFPYAISLRAPHSMCRTEIAYGATGYLIAYGVYQPPSKAAAGGES
eukprot:3941652-Rhodomonas_salina.1